jgi:hypothetical protein
MILRFTRKLRRLISFIPVIWRGADYDYEYSIELFKHQLKRTAEYLESEQATTESAKVNAQKIRTALRLMDKAYADIFVVDFLPDEYYNFETYEDEVYYLQNRKDRTHKILWKFIEHNIQKWWD